MSLSFKVDWCAIWQCILQFFFASNIFNCKELVLKSSQMFQNSTGTVCGCDFTSIRRGSYWTTLDGEVYVAVIFIYFWQNERIGISSSKHGLWSYPPCSLLTFVINNDFVLMHVAIGGRFVVQNVTKTSVTYTGILLRVPSNNLFTCFFGRNRE